MNIEYTTGFVAACVDRGIDPVQLVKRAQGTVINGSPVYIPNEFFKARPGGGEGEDGGMGLGSMLGLGGLAGLAGLAAWYKMKGGNFGSLAKRLQYGLAKRQTMLGKNPNTGWWDQVKGVADAFNPEDVPESTFVAGGVPATLASLQGKNGLQANDALREQGRQRKALEAQQLKAHEAPAAVPALAPKVSPIPEQAP